MSPRLGCSLWLLPPMPSPSREKKRRDSDSFDVTNKKVTGVRIAAYYNQRELPKNQQRPAKQDVMWQTYPAVMAATRAPELFQHQALHFRGTPHPFETVRFPKDAPTPLDDRRHINWFGYRRQRWAEHWLPEEEDDEPVPEMTLDEVRMFLTHRFGTLKKAFEKLDFIKNGRISAIEWQEGLFSLLYSSYGQHDQSGGTQASKYHLSKVPRWLFNERMMKLYNIIDKDGNGEISYFELADAQGRPTEQVHAFTRRRALEEAGYQKMTKQDIALEQVRKAEAEYKEAADEEEEEEEEEEDDDGGIKSEVKYFTAFIMQQFPDVTKAFRAFDTNGNGALSAIEFEQGALSCGFKGNCGKIYRYLDDDKSGNISVHEFKKLLMPSKKAMARVTLLLAERRKTKIDIEERRRGGIKAPDPFKRGLCLDDMDMHCKKGPNVGSSAGFYTMPRLPTRRMDPPQYYHPEQVPGTDPENFTDERGPGYCKKGPEYFSNVGLANHPFRGSAWKMGGNRNRTMKIGPLIPSKEGSADLAKSASGFAVYEGSGGKDMRKVCDTGAVSMKDKRERLGPTLEFDNFPGVIAPQKVGTFRNSRKGLRSLSEPDLN